MYTRLARVTENAFTQHKFVHLFVSKDDKKMHELVYPKFLTKYGRRLMLLQAFMLVERIDNTILCWRSGQTRPNDGYRALQPKIKAWAKTYVCARKFCWGVGHSNFLLLEMLDEWQRQEKIVLIPYQRMARKRPKIFLKIKNPKRSQSVRHCSAFTAIESTTMLITALSFTRNEKRLSLWAVLLHLRTTTCSMLKWPSFRSKWNS